MVPLSQITPSLSAFPSSLIGKDVIVTILHGYFNDKVRSCWAITSIEHVFNKYSFPIAYSSIKIRNWYRKQLAVNRVVLILGRTLECAEGFLNSTSAYRERHKSGGSRTRVMVYLPEWWLQRCVHFIIIPYSVHL